MSSLLCVDTVPTGVSSTPLCVSRQTHATPRSSSALLTPAAQTPLPPTPLSHQREKFLTPAGFYNSNDWGTPSWGHDDAKALQDALSNISSHQTGSNALQTLAITPGILRSTNKKSIAGINSATRTGSPKVNFKEKLTESFQDSPVDHFPETPLDTSSLLNTPSLRNRTVVTGSARQRPKGTSNTTSIDERENLLSTAILATPKTKSPKFGMAIDIDQSLHHIDACIKSPMDFGSPAR